MPHLDLRLLPLVASLAVFAAPAGAAQSTPQCPLPQAIQSSAAKRSTLSVVASRSGSSVTVCGTVKPRNAATRVVVTVRRGKRNLGSGRQRLKAGHFAVRIKLAKDPGAIRIVVTAGPLHLTRTLP